MKEDIKVLYDEVFDENGEVKLCGRYACMGLISACEDIEPGTDFGNTDTGFMNIENIKRLVGSLVNK